ncbi:MAG: accessory Sec system translocase SecA2 [Calditrichaceae bacterium]|nr:accessory Sec system translocase SecA2 [Calditrichaceae bacterium]MBN2708551.1 accessory Sec system translocase SecA2 [Calditrichaceae bacterium]
MSSLSFIENIKSKYHRLVNTERNKAILFFNHLLYKIRKTEKDLLQKPDIYLKDMFKTLKYRAGQSIDIDVLLPEVYALVSTVIQRCLKLKPFDVQIYGAVAMHHGRIIEMPTGEGKTLTAVFPVVLNALTGLGVHVLTFNDYLAERDAEWMGPVYKYLGLSAGFVKEGMAATDRRQAYDSDITYLSAKEAGFDYLRDSLCYNWHERVQRSFHQAIIDEADSILIDEARIPLVIAGSNDNFVPDTCRMALLAKKLVPDIDFEFDEYQRNFYLTDTGTAKVEMELKCGNIYNSENYTLLTQLNCAIHAENLLVNGIDYIVRNHKIELVDEFTGRIADRRRWPDGLQAALEAKENLVQQKQGEILNTLTLQHFIGLYPRVCGMTGTAVTAENEFRRFYNLEALAIPHNKPCIRQDLPDAVFATRKEKMQAVIDEIVKAQQSGRPVLVGTTSVCESEQLADFLRGVGVNCQVLNARNDWHEAEIIAQAGKVGAVTISTNMAGRGTDIRLGGPDEVEKDRVIRLGGLYVIGTNKHESCRIDLQLKGRAGRQGDPGSSKFFISLEDELFSRYKLRELLPVKFNQTGMKKLSDNKILSREISRVQRIVEGQNLEIKKTLQKYSDILEKQRLIIFNKRSEYMHEDRAATFFKSQITTKIRMIEAGLGKKQAAEVCKRLMLYHIDKSWTRYLADVAELRESIHLRRIGGQDPLYEFQKTVIGMFDEMFYETEQDALASLRKLTVSDSRVILQGEKYKMPSATWTYLINDNPFENIIGLQMIGNIGMQLGGGMLGGVFALRQIFRKFRGK